jgi:hypothetical protein
LFYWLVNATAALSLFEGLSWALRPAAEIVMRAASALNLWIPGVADAFAFSPRLATLGGH